MSPWTEPPGAALPGGARAVRQAAWRWSRAARQQADERSRRSPARGPRRLRAARSARRGAACSAAARPKAPFLPEPSGDLRATRDPAARDGRATPPRSRIAAGRRSSARQRVALTEMHLRAPPAGWDRASRPRARGLRSCLSRHAMVYPPGSSVRRRIRALCTCDFDVPSAIPSTSPTSLCSRPSMSCSTNAARQPSGSSAQRPFQIHPAHRPLGEAAAARVRDPRLVVQRLGHLAGPRRAAPQVVQAEVRRQPVEPRAERRVAAKRIELPVHRRERSPAAGPRRPPGCRPSGSVRLNSRPEWARYSSSNAPRSPAGSARRAPGRPPGRAARRPGPRCAGDLWS